MKRGGLAEAAVNLAWVAPSVPALLALARRRAPDTWSLVRSDPGTVLLLLRSPFLRALPPDQYNLPDLVRSPEPLDAAVRLLRAHGEEQPPHTTHHLVNEACLDYARSAAHLAASVGCDAERAWVAGLLAPLGWLAVAAVAPDELPDPVSEADLGAAQRQRWGLDQGAIARRLARRWQLPAWLTGLLGRLGLPADVARPCGADPLLFSVTQLAVALVQQRGRGLGLPVGAAVGDLMEGLGLKAAELGEPAETPVAAHEAGSVRLSDVLALAAENRRLEAADGTARLEAELDVLHRALEEQRGREEQRLRARKLSALAEFAAGAGHEINNPLAVISGQAQYLLGHEDDPGRRKALETVIGQTQRIHRLLRDVMQFARPPAPCPQPTDLNRLIDEVAVALTPLAEERKVRLRLRETVEEAAARGWDIVAARPVAPVACTVVADPGQLRTALTCLVRNAVEAAGPDGWAVVRLAQPRPGVVEVVVEDSGPELPPAQREHLFDPFYSGRTAGRGTGLGLPTAWSLARQQGGDVFLASQPGEPTRFVLRLPVGDRGVCVPLAG